jgi:uncharacterized protein
VTHPPRFLDTNILLRLLTRDDETKAEQSLALLLRIEDGGERVVTSHLVIFETVFTLQRSYRLSREQIRDSVLPIITLSGLQLEEKGLYAPAFQLYIDLNISFADAYNAAFMLANDLNEVYSWDGHFDRVEGISRVIPNGDPV